MGSSMFKGAATAQISEKGTKLHPGKALVEITKILMPANLKNGDRYIVEYKVVEADTGTDEKTGRPFDAPGDKRSWTQDMSKKTSALPALNCFMFAACGYDRKNRDDAAKIETAVKPSVEDLLEASIDESDPMKFVGRKLWVEVTATKTGAGHDFLRHDFAPGQSDKLV